MHAPGEPGDLPYAVGCPVFTRELRQVQWPSTKNFKPDVPEKYDGKMHPSEFLSIYTIAVQAAGGRDEAETCTPADLTQVRGSPER